MKTTEVNYTPIQLKSQVDMERIIEINDSVYTFNEVVSHIDLKNTLYCQEHGMEKYMKFPMYEKETKDKKYRDDPYRAVNFRVNEAGRLVCPNGKEFLFLRTEPVKGNQYGRTVELHQCEDCSGCPHRSKCHKSRFDRIIRLNYELTSIHKEVLDNLNSIHGALLRMNRSIQSKKCRRKTNFLRLWLVYTFLREKLSTALMGKKRQTLSVSGKSLRFPFGVI